MHIYMYVRGYYPAPISEKLGRLLIQKVYKTKVRKSQCPAALLTSVPSTATQLRYTINANILRANLFDFDKKFLYIHSMQT